MRGHYLRRDLPDGHADRLLTLADELIEGAGELHDGSQSRDLTDRYHAAIDADRLMRRVADRLRQLARIERTPG